MKACFCGQWMQNRATEGLWIEECEYSHPPFLFITFLVQHYTSLNLTYMLYRRNRLLKAFCASFWGVFSVKQHAHTSQVQDYPPQRSYFFLTQCLEKIWASLLPSMEAHASSQRGFPFFITRISLKSFFLFLFSCLNISLDRIMYVYRSFEIMFWACLWCKDNQFPLCIPSVCIGCFVCLLVCVTAHKNA